MEQVWQFAGSSKEGESFEIRGMNVWEQGWQVSPGQEAHVHDPVYGQGFVFRVYTVQDGEEKVEFAAGEFSNGVWGFFTRE
ncbi:MAG TPA: hypothetical protein VK888_03395 [Anaerolineales bacterium]|nr:hypothetical protein [Anaerolineales bacterium]